MKNKNLFALTLILTLTTALAFSNCRCGFAACPGIAEAAQAKGSSCHHETPKAKNPSPLSHEDCCGQCRIEKTATLSKDTLLTNDTRFQKFSAAHPLLGAMQEKQTAPRPFFFESQNPGPPFFVRGILNTTVSFRGPPLG